MCTIGPTSSTPETVRALVDAGMDVARINFSHGNYEDHRLRLKLVREAADDRGRVVAAMADLSGPKVRLQELAGGWISLVPGQRFELGGHGEVGDERGADTTHAGLAGDLEPGDRILLADGAVEMVAIETRGETVVCEVVKAVRDGRVSNRAGVNIPAEHLSLPGITDKDRRDLAVALDFGFDMVAQSFVRSAADVVEFRSLMGDREVPIVAKIENRPAVADAAAIARTADVVMVARGDLGVEIPLEEVPVVQKDLIRKCREVGTPTVVATQMLESMLNSSRPTRAEASDTANAVLDGADAVMLSGETAIGGFPVDAAATAVRIVEVAEERGEAYRLPPPAFPSPDASRAIARAAVQVIRSTPDVAAVACFTTTGRSAILVAAERPSVPVYAFAPDPRMVRALAVAWGLTPMLSESPPDVDALIEMMDRRLVEGGFVPAGQLVVMVAAAPVGRAATNLLKVHLLGDPGTHP